MISRIELRSKFNDSFLSRYVMTRDKPSSEMSKCLQVGQEILAQDTVSFSDPQQFSLQIMKDVGHTKAS